MKDKKKFRIITTVIAVIVVAVWMSTWMNSQNGGLEESGLFVTETVEAEVKNVISLLDAEDYETLQNISDAAMKEALTPEVWGAAKVQLSENWGAPKKLGTIYLSEATQDDVPMAVGRVKATYENVKVTYTIVFNQEMKLAGLYVK